MNFDRISRHFISIRNFYFLNLFSQNGCWRPFWMTENHFRIAFLAFSNQYATLFFFKMAAGGYFGSPIWAILSASHFSPFQINIQFLFIFYLFIKWLPAAILDDQKSLSIAFLAISDQYTIFFCIFVQNGHQGPFWKSDLRQKQYGSSTMFYQRLCQV